MHGRGKMNPILDGNIAFLVTIGISCHTTLKTTFGDFPFKFKLELGLEFDNISKFCVA